MTNEQAVIQAEVEIEKLKQAYMQHLNKVVIDIHESGIPPSLQDLLMCQKLGAQYFNFIENFVGSSGLLGAHANGRWVTGFAETCHSVLKAFVVHVEFLKSYSIQFSGALELPDEVAYANMQRMTKEYLPKAHWQQLEKAFKEASLSVIGFNYAGVNDLIKTPSWQLITGIIIGVLFSLLILALAIIIPSPTPTQFFIFRGMFAVSLSAIAAIIPGLLNIESRFHKMSIRATGAIAIFILVWLLNPPALLGG
jgi:hypothetical protein